MKIIVSILFVLFMVDSMQAYSKKIVLGTFTTKERADRMFKELQKPLKSKEISSFIDENRINVHVRPLGKNYILAVEPFESKDKLIEGLSLLRPKFKGVFVSDTNVKKNKKDVKETVEVKKEKISSKNLKKITFGTFKNRYGAQKRLKDILNSSRYEKLRKLSKDNNFVIDMRKLGDFYILAVEPIWGKDLINKVVKEVKRDFPGAFISDTSKNEFMVDVEVENEISTLTLKEDEKILEKSTKPVEVQESFSVEVVDEKLQNIVEVDKAFESVDNEMAQEEKNETATEKEMSVEEDISKEIENVSESVVIDTVDAIQSNNDESSENIVEYKPVETSTIEVIQKEISKLFSRTTEHWIWRELPSYLGYLFLIVLLSVGAYYFVKFKKIYDEY